MNTKILKFIVVTILTSSFSYAKLPAVFSTLEARLNELTLVNEGETTLDDLKDLSVSQNIDVALSYENYFKAKREVNIARSEFSPLNTGHALGLSLGLNYLWEAVVADAILSIPMRGYRVKSKKYVRKAQYYNHLEMQATIKNDLAHLYYDILIHEMILKTIDLEAELITEFYKVNKIEAKDLNKRLLILGIERLDIEMIYIKEMEAFKNLLAINFDMNVDKLSPIDSTIDTEKLSNIDITDLKHDAIFKNPKFLSYANLTAAAKYGVKSTKWSIITFSGLNFSYGKRVKLSKSSYRQAQLREDSEARKIRVNLIGSYAKLVSSSKVSGHYTSMYQQTLALFSEILDNNEYGLVSDEAGLRISLDLLRDYRDHSLAKYKSFSSFDDFNNASKANLSIADYSKEETSIEESPIVLKTAIAE